jgi:prepilin-type N-terminal cleavage/methylation domain-containing protein
MIGHLKENAMRRSGFTLIEMLVVLAIVLLLFGLAFGAYSQAVHTAKVDSTRTTILQLHRAIMWRSENFSRQNFRTAAQALQFQYDSAGNPSPNDKLPLELAKILVVKNQFRGTFPQRLEDLFGIDGQPGTDDDSVLWERWKRTCNDNGLLVTDADIRPTGHRIDLENSELLYLFLKSGSFDEGAFDVDRIKLRHVRDANNNGHPEIIDDWENPLRFYNWPTRLVRPGGNGQPIDQEVFTQTARQFLAFAGPPKTPVPFPHDEYNHPLNSDADDPFGSLAAAQTATGMLGAQFGLNTNKYGSAPNVVMCPPFDEAHYHTLDTYCVPLIISAGPDGRLGLIDPTEQSSHERRNADIESIDETFDNVSISAN